MPFVPSPTLGIFCIAGGLFLLLCTLQVKHCTLSLPFISTSLACKRNGTRKWQKIFEKYLILMFNPFLVKRWFCVKIQKLIISYFLFQGVQNSDASWYFCRIQQAQGGLFDFDYFFITFYQAVAYFFCLYIFSVIITTFVVPLQFLSFSHLRFF